MYQGNGDVTVVHPFVLFSGKITCILRTIVKVCRCCDKPYILIISFFLLAYYELKKKNVDGKQEDIIWKGDYDIL